MADREPFQETIRPETPLAEGYYLDNFATLLDTVAEHDATLFGDAEGAFLEGFEALSLTARRLYVRLVSRKGPLLRRDRLAYDEIPNLDDALAELRAAGFADDAPDAPAEELLALLLRAELLELATDLDDVASPARAARRTEILAALDGVDTTTITAWMRPRIEIVRPLRLEVVTVFRLLFFGNLRQDLTEFVLRDLGVVRFESYELRRELRLFRERQAVDDVLHLAAGRRAMRELLEAEDWEGAKELGRAVLARRDAWHTASHRHLDRLALKLGRALERRGELKEALGVYLAADAPPARERRARILDRLGRPDDALALCREIEAAPRDETEIVFAPRFAKALRRRLGESVEAERRPRRPSRELVLESWAETGVEAVALVALEAAGRRGVFAENWLWKALFGLAFWDIVFAPVPGAFQHPFQYGPLDVHTSDFRRAREDLVAARLAELRGAPSPAARILARHDEKEGLANPFVGWSPGLRPALELVLERLSGTHLAAVCDRLSRDPRRYGRGLPDLFVLRDDAPGFELLEVKSPTDQLRPEQGRWIDYLNAHGLPAKVLRISAADLSET